MHVAKLYNITKTEECLDKSKMGAFWSLLNVKVLRDSPWPRNISAWLLWQIENDKVFIYTACTSCESENS